jgi:hypothetical protein
MKKHYCPTCKTRMESRMMEMWCPDCGTLQNLWTGDVKKPKWTKKLTGGEVCTVMYILEKYGPINQSMAFGDTEE